MKWFKHDSNAQADAKLERLIIRHGLEGYGLYWYCLELIVGNIEAHNLTFELEHDAEVLAHRLRMHVDKVNEMMAYMIDLGLFEINNQRITCLKLAKRLDSSMTSNPKFRQLIKKNHDAVMTVSTDHHDGVMMKSSTRHDSVMLEEKRREEISSSLPSQVDDEFEKFWNMYPRRDDKKKAKTAWNKLKKADKEEALKGLKTQLPDLSSREKRFIPLPSSWLNGMRWQDEGAAKKLTINKEVAI